MQSDLLLLGQDFIISVNEFFFIILMERSLNSDF